MAMWMFLLVATRIGQLRIKSKCIRIRSAQFCFICFLFLRLIEIVIGVKMCGHLSVPHEWLFCFVSKFFPFIFSFVLLFCVLFHLQLFFSTKNKKKKRRKDRRVWFIKIVFIFRFSLIIFLSHKRKLKKYIIRFVVFVLKIVYVFYYYYYFIFSLSFCWMFVLFVLETLNAFLTL